MSSNKAFLTSQGVLLTMVFAVGSILAFSCRRLIKAADESIAKAESQAADTL